MKFKQALIITLILISSLSSSEAAKKLLEAVSNTKSKLSYFFFIKDHRAFLVKEEKTDINQSTPKKIYKVWNYTKQRKWRPISNTKEYDGYKASVNHFHNLTINKQRKTISFGNIVNYNNELPYNRYTREVDEDSDILPLLRTIENETIPIGWYFWNEKNKSFLISGDNTKGIKMWNYTQDRKWLPLYNTSGFDGFEKAGDTLRDVKFEIKAVDDSFYINIGKINLAQNAFIMTIKTDKQTISGLPGTNKQKSNFSISSNKQYAILTDSSYEYDYSVDCNNDGIYEAQHLNDKYICEYEQAGEYDVIINGIYPSRGIKRNQKYDIYSDNGKILNIKQWGNIEWKDMSYAFMYADKLTISAKDTPNFSSLQNMSSMFYYTLSFNQDISKWDVSNVVKMDDLFRYSAFNRDISKWNVSKVVDMSYIFASTDFNQDISKWNVSNVTNMNGMFSRTKFNKDISSWNVSKVASMENMFYKSEFNKNISNWNVSSVTRMDSMFNDARAFNQNISKWNVSNVLNISGMFLNATSFNQDISNWNINSEANSVHMFRGATVMEEKNKPKGIKDDDEGGSDGGLPSN